MEFVRDKVLRNILRDRNNNRQINPIIYLVEFYKSLRSQVDISTEKNLISAKNGNQHKIFRIQNNREKILNFIENHQEKTLENVYQNMEHFQEQLDKFSEVNLFQILILTIKTVKSLRVKK